MIYPSRSAVVALRNRVLDETTIAQARHLSIADVDTLAYLALQRTPDAQPSDLFTTYRAR